MADGIEVVLTLGYDTMSKRDGELHEYLMSSLGVASQDGVSDSGQHLDLVSSNDLYPHGLPGSGQAGAIRIYAGLIRRGSTSGILEFLHRAPWGSHSGVVVIEDEYDNAPTVAQFPLRGAR